MKGIYSVVASGALFKKKKEPSGRPPVAKDRETEMRKRVLDEYRGREDALREREAAVAAREERLEKDRAELARRLQEIASGAGPQTAAPAEEEAIREPARVTAQARSVRDIERQMKTMEEELEKVRAVHRELTALEKRRGEYLERLISYKTRGYSVGRLESVMGKSPEEVEKAFRAFQKDVDTLSALAARCDRVDPVFVTEAEALKALCTRPEAIGEVEKGIRELEARERNKKMLLMDRVVRWRREGFGTARFDRLEGAPLGELEEAVLRYDEDIGALRRLGERLGALDGAYASDAAALLPLLKDPDRIGELETAISRLESGPPGSATVSVAQDSGAAIEGAAQGQATPAQDKSEEEVMGLLAETEKSIAELNASGIDPVAAENLLRMAKSFTRSKNFPKALEYARKARQTALGLKDGAAGNES